MNKLIKYMGPFIGPFFFLLVLILPTDLSTKQQNFLAVFSYVVANWLLTSIPLFITGFIGISLSVLMGVTTAAIAFAPFANPIIFLFLGGFLFATAMQSTGLDKRISLIILNHKAIRGSFSKTLLALYGLTVFFSMWVSNTATTALMLPIIIGIVTNLNIKDQNITSIILLGLAYSASIGGLATPIGSPPNIIAIGMLDEIAGIHISFLQWMFYATPFVIFFMFILFKIILSKIPNDLKHFDGSFIQKQYDELKPLDPKDIIIMVLFSLTVFFWFTPGIIRNFVDDPQMVTFLKDNLNSGVIALIFSSLFFIFPFGDGTKILDQKDIKKIDWASLLLFGSGLSLGKILYDTGLAKYSAELVINNFVGNSFLILLFIIIFLTVFSTELISNTASANILIPIIIALSMEMEIAAEIPVVAMTLACSLAFMLPVATPPNTIVYGSEMVKKETMIKLGFFLNITFGLLLVCAFYFISLIKS